MIRTSLAVAALCTLAAGCSDDAPGSDAAIDAVEADARTLNPPRLWLNAVEIIGTIELVDTEPVPY